MPLRDHIRPPVMKIASPEGFHAMWPTCIVQHLRQLLPPGFVAAPRVSKEPSVNEYEYQVRIYDATQERTLVAIVEFVCLANKDRPDAREAFVAKCAALLRKSVAVSIVDWSRSVSSIYMPS
jgi:hypothetical protein